MRRLTASEVKVIRNQQIISQGNKCAICGRPGVADDPVLDHCHSTGAVRATLHRSCNALLGVIENNWRRFGIGTKPNLFAFLNGTARYLAIHQENRTGLLHPTHKTEDEKKLKRAKAARVARAKKKVQA